MGTNASRVSGLLSLLFVLAFAHSTANAMSWIDGGGDETDATVEAATESCTDKSISVELCQAWGLEWQLIFHKQGGSIAGAGGESEQVNIIKRFDTFNEALSCINFDIDSSTATCADASSEDWRLPNIRELSKAFRYTAGTGEVGNTALAYPVMRKWFNGLYINDDEDPAVTQEFTSGNDILAAYTPYVISSTYRDLDGKGSNGEVQFLAMNLKTGAIVSITHDGNLCSVPNINGTCASGFTELDYTSPLIVIRVKTYTP